MAIRVDPNSFFGRLSLVVAAHLVRWLIAALGRSCRLDIVAGSEHLAALREQPRPVILSFWHNRSFLSAPFLLNALHRRGFGVTLLASQSRDGELVTTIGKQWGLPIVRGSASRGGSSALRGVYRALTRQRSSPIMIPDGPRGPLYHFKLGVVVLAKMSEAPILPLGFAASRYWTLGSWDLMIVPRPFARVALVIGEPQALARTLDSDELEAERQRLEALVTRLTRKAESAVGAKDPAGVAEAAKDGKMENA